jgi:SAM-dependent methyltransferase
MEAESSFLAGPAGGALKAPPALEEAVRRKGGRQVQLGWTEFEDITEELSRHGIPVQSRRIDVKAFWNYVQDAGYRQSNYMEDGRHPAAIEKYFEHFVSIDLLQLKPRDVLIDVASCNSPFPEIASRLLGCRAYRQDLWYEPGVHGERIGSDVAAIPLPAGFADKLSLHCSFEHFEGDRDKLFLREAARILRPGGLLCILPLYTNRTYRIQTDPAAWGDTPFEFESDALICIAPDWKERHGRVYDAPHFLDRVVGHMGDLELTLYRVENLHEVDPSCYLRFAAVFRKPA